jgi:hypothetical protein
MSMAERWDLDVRLLLVSNLQTQEPASWCLPRALHNSYADSDDLETMWNYNQALVESFQRQDDRLFKCDLSLPRSCRMLYP